MGVEVVVVPPMMDQGQPVSSTRIRRYLKEGDIVSANRLLGYEYSYDTMMMVVDGLKNGRKIGIPTINQEFDPRLFDSKKFGVYALKGLGGRKGIAWDNQYRCEANYTRSQKSVG